MQNDETVINETAVTQPVCIWKKYRSCFLWDQHCIAGMQKVYSRSEKLGHHDIIKTFILTSHYLEAGVQPRFC